MINQGSKEELVELHHQLSIGVGKAEGAGAGADDIGERSPEDRRDEVGSPLNLEHFVGGREPSHRGAVGRGSDAADDGPGAVRFTVLGSRIKL